MKKTRVQKSHATVPLMQIFPFQSLQTNMGQFWDPAVRLIIIFSLQLYIGIGKYEHIQFQFEYPTYWNIFHPS